jgi:hypothetical protein
MGRRLDCCFDAGSVVPGYESKDWVHACLVRYEVQVVGIDALGEYG